MARHAANVRSARVADVPALVELMYGFHAESGYALDRPGAERAFRTLLAQPALGGAWLAAAADAGEPGSAALGYVVLVARFDMDVGGLLGCIEDLYVRPEARRGGVARALLETLCADCRRRGCGALRVEVAADNDAAISLYRGFGLAPLGDGRLIMSGVLPGD